MKAVILAGGFATRLRPLSCSKPKLLFPIVGVPLIDFMIPWLRDGGVRDAILAVNHLSERLRQELGQERLGSRVIFSVETQPLGTAGPIRLARKWLANEEAFVVVNGDIVSNVDLDKLVKHHEDHSAAATVALVSVEDPRQYGSVTATKNGLVSRFEEKKKQRSRSGLVNAGVYVLSRSVLDYIPSTGPASLERDVFPKLAGKGVMWSWTHQGFWFDIGRVSEYLRANMYLLERNARFGGVGRSGGTTVGNGVPPVYIGEESTLGARARIGPRCILSDRVRVGDGSVLKNSIVFEDTVIGNECYLDGALIGERVVVGEKSRIGRGAIVAGQISIPAESHVKPGSVILV